MIYKKRYLHLPEDDEKTVQCQWNLRFLAILLFAYLFCVMPWMVNEIVAIMVDTGTLFLYKEIHFSSQPGVADEFWENEAEGCLVVA